MFIMAYCIGIMINKNNWMDEIGKKSFERVLLLIIPVLVIFSIVIGYVVMNIGDITYLLGGANVFSLLYSFF